VINYQFWFLVLAVSRGNGVFSRRAPLHCPIPLVDFRTFQRPKRSSVLYGDNHDGVLQFSGDAKFDYHTEIYHRSFLLYSPKTYRYLFDAPNPFAPELGAHHAVDHCTSSAASSCYLSRKHLGTR